MKAAEVKTMTVEELTQEVSRLQKKIYDLRCQTATDKIEDTSLFKKTRRDIARMMTEQNARRKVKA